MITLSQLKDDVVDAVINLLIDNRVIDNISDLQRVVDPSTGQITIGRINDEPIVLYQQDYQKYNQDFIDVMASITTCLHIDNG